MASFSSSMLMYVFQQMKGLKLLIYTCSVKNNCHLRELVVASGSMKEFNEGQSHVSYELIHFFLLRNIQGGGPIPPPHIYSNMNNTRAYWWKENCRFLLIFVSGTNKIPFIYFTVVLSVKRPLSLINLKKNG